MATVFTTIDRIETPDPQTVVIHTKDPDALMPARLAFFGGQILPKRYVEQVGAAGFNAKPVGTGPARFVEWIKDDHLTLTAVPDYWGSRIDVDRVVIRAIPEVGPRIAALLRGEVDIITKLPPDHVEEVRQHSRTKVGDALYAGLYALIVAFAPRPARQPEGQTGTRSPSIEEASSRTLAGAGIVPNGPIPKGDNYYDESWPPLRYDPPREAAAPRGWLPGRADLSRVHDADRQREGDERGRGPDVARCRGERPAPELLEFSVIMQKIREKSLKGHALGRPTSTLRDPDGMIWRLLGPGLASELAESGSTNQEPPPT